MRRTEHFEASGFPYEVPAVAAIEDLRLDAPITRAFLDAPERFVRAALEDVQ